MASPQFPSPNSSQSTLFRNQTTQPEPHLTNRPLWHPKVNPNLISYFLWTRFLQLCTTCYLITDIQVNGQLPKSDQVTSPARDQQPPGQVLHPQLPDVAASAAARATVTAASPPQQQQVVSPKPTPPKPEPKPAETSVAAAPEPKSEPETKVAEKSVESVSQVPPSYATLVKSSGPPSGTGAIQAISPGIQCCCAKEYVFLVC